MFVLDNVLALIEAETLTLYETQSTFGGFGLINQDNVFKVCDQPHPLLVKEIIGSCLKLEIDNAYDGMSVRPLFAKSWTEFG